MATKILINRVSQDGLERISSKIGATAVLMKTPVKMNSTGLFEVAGNAANGSMAIGNLSYDNAYVASNSGTTLLAAAAPAEVILKGRTLQLTSGGTFTAGTYLKYNAAGLLIAEATATTKTVATEGIALETSTASGQDIVFLRQ